MIHPSTGLSRRIAQIATAAGISVALALGATPAVAAPRAAAATAEAQAAVATYVTAVYDDLFNRAPDASGLTSWTSALLTGTQRVAVANSITSSDEYRGRLITESYQRYLGRTPEPSGLAGWLGYLRGGSTLQLMEAGFLAAPEYYAKAGGTPAGWVTALYGNVLDRSAAPSEIAYWTGRMAAGTNRGQIALGFLLSTEHLSTVVDGYYRSLLGRSLEASGQATWVSAIQRGVRVEQVIGAIVASDEYINSHGGPVSITPPPSAPAPAPAPTPGAGTLTVVNGDLVVTTPGTVLDSLDVRGYVRVEAANVTIKNTIVRGRPGLTSTTGLVTNLGGFANLVIQDSELYAADPTPYINGFMGYNATLARVNIHHVIDSVHVTGSNVLIDSSWLHDNLHYDNDPNWNGGGSHDDNIQVQGGNNIVVRNSTITGSKNAAIMVTQDRAAVTGLVVTGNKLDNGACTINLAQKTYGPIAATITGNSFGTGQIYKYCGVKAATTTTAVSTVSANSFSDGRTFTVTP